MSVNNHQLEIYTCFKQIIKLIKLINTSPVSRTVPDWSQTRLSLYFANQTTDKHTYMFLNTCVL